MMQMLSLRLVMAATRTMVAMVAIISPLYVLGPLAEKYLS
jgi:hypothetical protein